VNHVTHCLERAELLRRRFLFPLALLFAIAPAFASDAAKVKQPPPKEDKGPGFFHDLLPLAWQKHPKVRFNVYTEMTPVGRQWRVPTTDKPMYYFSNPGQFVQTGWEVASGEKPPPKEELAEALKKALAANGYVPVADDHQRPDLLVVFTFGSSGTNPLAVMTDVELADDPNPNTAEILVNGLMHDPALYQDVIGRARLVAGDKFALEMKAAIDGEFRNRRFNQTVDHLPPPVDKTAYLPVSPDGGSPFQLFLSDGNGNNQNLAELAFHTIYFVTATAYDFGGVETRKKIPLWQTRMVVEAQGVAMGEILKPLIANTGSYLGRETPEAVVVTKRVDREGHVDIGPTTVVEEAKPAATGEKSNPR
jgi:hypothetical protein